MPKLILDDVVAGYAVASKINANNDEVIDALENTLSRDGTSPNQMNAELDMNSNQVINLGAPANQNDAARLQDVQDALGAANGTPVSTANLVLITDAGAHYSSNNVEGALAEIGQTLEDGIAPFYETTTAETAILMPIANHAYPELNVSRYGAIGDYNGSTGTDNLAAFNRAIDVAAERDGGTIVVDNGDYLVSNTLDARGINNIYLRVSPGTTLRTNKYTSDGGLWIAGHVGPVGSGIFNVGVGGGGIMRTHKPDHSTTVAFDLVTNENVTVGQYRKSIDTNGEARAYYVKTAGLTDHTDPPDAVNGSSTSGTAVFQDADNDNIIGLAAENVTIEDLYFPEASGKFVTIQIPTWKNVTLRRLRGGRTNDKGYEIKGNTAAAGQEAAFGDGVFVQDVTAEWTGREGLEIEQSSFSSALNQNAVVNDVLIRSAGNIAAASGIRINRCNRVKTTGSRVLQASSNGFHIRLCARITGDTHSENCGAHGLHLQSNTDFSLTSVYAKTCVGSGVAESSDVGGGFFGRIVVDGAVNGYLTSSRSGSAPVVASYRFTNLSGVAFSGDSPTIIDNVEAAKLQSFTLTFANPGGSQLQHQFVDDVLNSAASQYVDRIVAATNTLHDTPSATNLSTAFAFGGKVSSAATNEFIFNHTNVATQSSGVKSAIEVYNTTGDPLRAALVRRQINVNGTDMTRWHLQLRKQSDNSNWAINTTNIAAGELVSIQINMYLP